MNYSMLYPELEEKLQNTSARWRDRAVKTSLSFANNTLRKEGGHTGWV